MKNLYAFVICCIALAVASCSHYEEEVFVPTVDPSAGQGRLYRFSAANELTNTEGSRAGIDVGHTSIWSNNDNLSVVRFDSRDKAPVLINCHSSENSLSEDRKKISFACGENSNDNATDSYVYKTGGEQYAIYPQIDNAEPVDFAGGVANTRKFKINLPDQKLQGETDFHYPLLIGRWDDNNEMFMFRNPLATIKLTIKAPASKTYHLR